MKKIFIGFDSREKICYEVCKYSILANTNETLSISPIKLNNLKNIYKRKTDPLASTEFTYSRFLVPYLNNYNGITLFCDCDFVFLTDIKFLFELYNNKYAVMVCKHDYKPTSTTKMDGCVQTAFPRKNWSSLILWNCSHPKNKILTPNIVNSQTGKFLHRFEWLDDSEIGELPLQWNWLVGWYKEPKDGTPLALHYTEGGPWFDNYKNCDYSDVWLTYKSKIIG